MLPTQIHENVKLGYAANVLLSLRWSISFIVCYLHAFLVQKEGKETAKYYLV